MIWGDRIPSPIIIIGAARSGTKFLRDVLAASRGAKAVGYDVNYVWRYGIDSDAHDRLDPDGLTEERRAFIRNSLSRLARLEPDQCLIEKTVSNTLRIPFVSAVFPTARYVHLIRNGRDTTESAMRQWRAPPDPRALWKKLRGLPIRNFGYALWFAKNTVAGLISGRKGGKVWGPRYPSIDEDLGTRSLAEICALQWKYSVYYALEDLAYIPADRVFEIRYEDLASGPEALSSLVSDLELVDRDSILTRYQAMIQNGTGDRWRALPEADLKRIEDILGPILRDLGYGVGSHQ